MSVKYFKCTASGNTLRLVDPSVADLVGMAASVAVGSYEAVSAAEAKRLDKEFEDRAAITLAGAKATESRKAAAAKLEAQAVAEVLAGNGGTASDADSVVKGKNNMRFVPNPEVIDV